MLTPPCIRSALLIPEKNNTRRVSATVQTCPSLSHTLPILGASLVLSLGAAPYDLFIPCLRDEVHTFKSGRYFFFYFPVSFVFIVSKAPGATMHN